MPSSTTTTVHSSSSINKKKIAVPPPPPPSTEDMSTTQIIATSNQKSSRNKRANAAAAAATAAADDIDKGTAAATVIAATEKAPLDERTTPTSKRFKGPQIPPSTPAVQLQTQKSIIWPISSQMRCKDDQWPEETEDQQQQDDLQSQSQALLTDVSFEDLVESQEMPPFGDSLATSTPIRPSKSAGQPRRIHDPHAFRETSPPTPEPAPTDNAIGDDSMDDLLATGQITTMPEETVS